MVEQSLITTALKEYNITDAAIEKLKSDYMAISVKDVNDKEGYDLAHTARMDIKSRRVDVEKKRKKLKEDALEYGRAVDKEAKRITSLLEPIETYLESQEKIVDDEKARIKAEAEAKEAARIQARIDRLFALGCSFNGQNYILPFAPAGYSCPQAIVKTCNDEQFETICGEYQKLVDVEKARIESEKAAKIEEEKRLDKIKEEQAAEAKRLADIQAAQDNQAAEIKAAQDAIEAEKKRIADVEAARLKAIADAQALENAKKEAADKARIETEARIKREADEKEKREVREKANAEKKAARAPDKVKLIALADAIDKVPFPELKTKEAAMYARNFNGQLAAALKYLRDEAEAL